MSEQAPWHSDFFSVTWKESGLFYFLAENCWFSNNHIREISPRGLQEATDLCHYALPFPDGFGEEPETKESYIHYWESLEKICLAKQFCMKRVRKYLTAKNINSFHQYAIFWIHLSKWLLRTVSKFAVLYNFKGLWKHQLVKWMEVFFNK